MTQSLYPIVSVIIPTYNRRAFIKFALESLFRQTYPEERMEIIVVDDGSTDGTGDILKEYTGKFIYMYQENRGIASARNRGVSIAKGEIVTFLDSDDEWREDRIQKMVEKFMDMPDVGIVYHPIELFDEKGQVIHRNFYKTFGYKEGLSGWIANDIIRGRIFCGGSSFAFRKKIMDKVYPIPEDIRRGIDFYSTLISACYAKAEYIHNVLGRYRLHSGNITMARGEDAFRELAIVNKDFAFMRQMLIDKMSNIKNDISKVMDLTMLKRIQAKEIIFYNILDGKRLEGIKRIPLLFRGIQNLRDLIKGVVISFMTLFIPAFLYPKLVKIFGLLKRLKILRV